MHELGIPAHGDHFGTRFPEFLVPLCQSGELGGSHESEIRRIKEQDGPFLCRFQLLQADAPEIAFNRIEYIEFEIRHFLTDLQTTASFRHGA
jgi:hypothetical protein